MARPQRRRHGPAEAGSAGRAGDVTGFRDGLGGAVGIAVAGEILGVVQQAVRQVVRGAPLAQAGDRGGEGRRGGPVAVGGGQAGVGQVTFGPQHRGDLAGLVRVKQGEQLADGGEVL